MSPSGRLLREYIRHLIIEDFDGGDIGYMGGFGGGGYGMYFASPDDMYSTFVKPFVDVVDVTAGKAKELSEKTKTLLKVAFETIATTVIPILRDSYGEIFKEEEEAIDRIRSEYADVYQATWDAFANHDVLVAAFMYNPVAFLTMGFAKRVPVAAAKLLSVVSAGELDPHIGKAIRTSKARKSKGSSKGGFGGVGYGYGGSLGSSGGGWSSYTGGDFTPTESIVREDASKPEPNPIAKLAADPRVKELLSSNPLVQKMEREGQEIVRGTLKRVYEQARAVAHARSLVDLQRALGKQLPGMDKLQQLPENERRSAEQQLLVMVKKSAAEFYVKSLQAQAKSAIGAGVPREHPYVKTYEDVIKKINSL